MKNFYKGGISILGVLVLAVIVIFVLSYFNISIKSVAESSTGQENINYVWGSAKTIWTAYLAAPAHYFWNDIVVNIFWKTFISNMERIRDGKPTDFEKAGEDLKVTIPNN